MSWFSNTIYFPRLSVGTRVVNETPRVQMSIKADTYLMMSIKEARSLAAALLQHADCAESEEYAADTTVSDTRREEV